MTEPTAGVYPAMPSSGWRGRGVVAFAALVCGLYGWAVFGFTLFGRDGEIGPTYYGVGGDYTVYYAAAHAYWDGTLPKIMDVASSRPWLYPPHFLLLLVPFGLLPFAQSYAAFMVVTFAAAVAGAWRWAGTPARRAFWVAALALAPAASVNVIEGQNAFLTAALLLQGFGLLGRADLLGGAILGLLSYKPQFALLLPVALLASRNWRALTAAGASVALVTAVSAAAFGLDFWRHWLGAMVAPDPGAYAAWLDQGRLWGLSVYTCALLLGAPAWLAQAAQMAVVLASAATVYQAFGRALHRDLQLAVLLAATLLAAPHVSSYDTTLLAAAAMLALGRMLDGAPPPCPLVLLLWLWLMPLLGPPRTAIAGFAVPPSIACFMLCVSRSGKKATGRKQ